MGKGEGIYMRRIINLIVEDESQAYENKNKKRDNIALEKMVGGFDIALGILLCWLLIFVLRAT